MGRFNPRNECCFPLLFVVSCCSTLACLLLLFSKDESSIATEKLMRSRKQLYDRYQVLNNKINRMMQQTTDTAPKEEYPQQTIYIITPTYTRLTQRADLTRLSQTLMHVKNLHWIIVEDSENKSDLVQSILKECGLPSTHLAIRTPDAARWNTNQKRHTKHRGVEQRNMGLLWIRNHIDKDKEGVVYFADDDNTYHLNLFNEMRTTKRVSMWPVGIVAALRWEGPICKDGKVKSFLTAFAPERAFPIDMAGFAINLQIILKAENAFLSYRSLKGYLESDFLNLMNITLDQLEAKADDCTKILVWHTRTETPKLKFENWFKKSDFSDTYYKIKI